jgi:hypothetical protein
MGSITRQPDYKAQLDGHDCTIEEFATTGTGESVYTLGTNKPDPEWEHTDDVGHVHRWYGDEIPTTKLIIDPYWCPECNEHHDRSTRVCLWCSDEIMPATISTGPGHVWVEGLKELTAIVRMLYPPDLNSSVPIWLTTDTIAVQVIPTTIDATVGEFQSVTLLGVGEPLTREHTDA